MKNNTTGKTVKDFYEEFEFERMVTKAPVLLDEFFSTEIDFITNTLFKEYIKEGKDILEVGCGFGRLLKLLAPHAHRAVGIDFSERMIREAQENLKEMSNTELILMDASSMSFADSSFDYVLCLNQTLGNMPGIDSQALSEMKRVTKRGGKIVLNVFSEIVKDAQIENYTRLGLANIQDDGTAVTTDEGFYSRRFTKEQVEDLFNDVGLKPEIFQVTKAGYIAVAEKE